MLSSTTGMRHSDLEPHLKERLRRLLPDYVCGINPLADFSQDAETVGVDSEDVGSFIEVLQAKMLESCGRAQVHRLQGQAHHCLRGRERSLP